MFKGRGIILFAVLFVIFSFSNNVFSENIKIQSASGSSNSLKLNAGQVKVSSSPSTSNDITISQGHITLQESGAQSIEVGTLGTGTTVTEPTAADSAVSEPKARKKERYEGASISRTNGGITSASVKSIKPKNVKQVTNLGKPQGVNAMARSVKSEVKYSDSPRMNKLKERKMKRRTNMKKELEEKRKKTGIKAIMADPYKQSN